MSSEPPQGRGSVWAWALYDFANSPFTTLTVTFVYAAFFTRVIAPDEISGTLYWSRGVTVTAVVVALVSPVAGAFADLGGLRKLFLALATAGCVLGSIGLYFVLPGQVLLAMAVFVAANICYELEQVFYNAFLPDVAGPARIGRVSGFGWGLGYLGGLLALLLALFTLVQPEVPWFGFSKEAGANLRAGNLLVAGWLLIFSLPTFLFVRQRGTGRERGAALVSGGLRQLRSTLGKIHRYPQLLRFLLARLLYNDGLITLFGFGGIYAAGTFGFDFEQILVFGIVLNVAAGSGAWAFGYLDDRLGGKQTILVSLVFLFAAGLLAAVARSASGLWVAGVIIGIFAGPAQSASRSLMGRFSPREHLNEFFGLFALSGKATAFAGPWLFGVATSAFGTQRAGVAVVLAFFALGLVLLLGVDESRGIEEAGNG